MCACAHPCTCPGIDTRTSSRKGTCEKELTASKGGTGGWAKSGRKTSLTIRSLGHFESFHLGYMSPTPNLTAKQFGQWSRGRKGVLGRGNNSKGRVAGRSGHALERDLGIQGSRPGLALGRSTRSPVSVKSSTPSTSPSGPSLPAVTAQALD